MCTSMVFQDVREEQNHYRMAAVEREQTVKQTLDTRQIWNLEYIDMKESKELRKSNSGQHSQSERPVQHVFLVGAKSLGAYGGWDDDLDIMMPRPDHDRFVEYFVNHREEFPNLKIFTPDLNKEYPYMITRVSDDRYRIVMENEKPYGMGAFIDIYRIKNAIILAAGMSTRFIPLNFEKPKGLLVVKGETLIERQIRHLREKGIEEIIVVVGYMKECFEFLKEKYGVILVEAKDYAERNNHASVYAAKEYLKNTIITSSDLYFSENIFQTYAYDSYYWYANSVMQSRSLVITIAVTLFLTLILRKQIGWKKSVAIIALAILAIIILQSQYFDTFVDSFDVSTYSTSIRLQGLAFYMEAINGHSLLGLIPLNTYESVKGGNWRYYISDLGTLSKFFEYGIIGFVIFNLPFIRSVYVNFIQLKGKSVVALSMTTSMLIRILMTIYLQLEIMMA